MHGGQSSQQPLIQNYYEWARSPTISLQSSKSRKLCLALEKGYARAKFWGGKGTRPRHWNSFHVTSKTAGAATTSAVTRTQIPSIIVNGYLPVTFLAVRGTTKISNYSLALWSDRGKARPKRIPRLPATITWSRVNVEVYSRIAGLKDCLKRVVGAGVKGAHPMGRVGAADCSIKARDTPNN